MEEDEGECGDKGTSSVIVVGTRERERGGALSVVIVRCTWMNAVPVVVTCGGRARRRSHTLRVSGHDDAVAIAQLQSSRRRRPHVRVASEGKVRAREVRK